MIRSMRMRTLALATFGALALVACSSGGSNDGSDAGSDGGATSPCTELVTEVCQKASSCSAGNDAGIVFLIGPDVDAGINSFGDTLHDASGNDEAGCERFVGLACEGNKAAGFTANCGAAVSSGLACGTDPHFGNGVEIPASCWNDI